MADAARTPALQIYKNYTNVTAGAPKPAALALDKSCKPPSATVRPPATREEAAAARQLGPYTALLRRHLNLA